jgi:murein hydrolase activator
MNSSPSLVLPLLLLLGLPAVLGAQEEQIRIHIGELREEIAAHEDKIQQSRIVEGSILDTLEEINREIEAQREKVQIRQRHLQEQQKVLAATEENLEHIQKERDQALQHMLVRLRSFYMMGKLGVLNVTFSSQNLPELMLKGDAFHEILAYDRGVIERYRLLVAALDRERFRHELAESHLEELLRWAEKEEQTLTALRDEREEVLLRVRLEQGLHQLAIEEMRQAEQTLRGTLSTIQRQRQQKTVLNREQSFLSVKGSLPLPASGSIIHRFGEVLKAGVRQGEKVTGLHIAVAPHTVVQAIYGGRVAFAGYRRGYGNTVIIDHGGNYFTLTSRLDTVLVQEEEMVKPRQQIGTSGDIATLYEPGLYFEIRKDSEPIDPMPWLDL